MSSHSWPRRMTSLQLPIRQVRICIVSPLAAQHRLTIKLSFYGEPSTAASSRHLEPSAFLLHLKEAPRRLKTSRRKAELEPGTRRNQQDPRSHLYAPSLFYGSKSRRLEVTVRLTGVNRPRTPKISHRTVWLLFQRNPPDSPVFYAV